MTRVQVLSLHAERVQRLVTQRLRLFDAIATVGTVARVRAPFQPLIASELAAARGFWRNQLRQLFAPELRVLGKATATSVIASIDVLTSYESVQLMRDDQQLSSVQIAAALTHSISALVAR